MSEYSLEEFVNDLESPNNKLCEFTPAQIVQFRRKLRDVMVPVLNKLEPKSIQDRARETKFIVKLTSFQEKHGIKKWSEKSWEIRGSAFHQRAFLKSSPIFIELVQKITKEIEGRTGLEGGILDMILPDEFNHRQFLVSDAKKIPLYEISWTRDRTGSHAIFLNLETLHTEIFRTCFFR